MYSVVEFRKEHSLMTVPNKWVFPNERYCYYPIDLSDTLIKKAVRKLQTPEIPGWGKLRISFHFTSNFFAECEKKVADLEKLAITESSEASSVDDFTNYPNVTQDEIESFSVTERNEHVEDGFPQTLENKMDIMIQQQKDILTELIVIRRRQEEHTQFFQNLKSVNSNFTLQPSKEYVLPIENIADLEKINKILEMEEEKKKLISYEVSYENRREKCTSLHISHYGKETICMTLKCQEDVVEQHIKNFLRTAKDRCGLRKKPATTVTSEHHTPRKLQRLTEAEYVDLEKTLTTDLEEEPTDDNNDVHT
ncbi:hypothetical protein FQR65_LT19652 [Abscondita terminalis]|nr:hypothetical protein FQR65_LT19652 [Abscondita terminalis]